MAGSPVDPGPERKKPDYRTGLLLPALAPGRSGRTVAKTGPVECVQCGAWPAPRSVWVDPEGRPERFCEACYWGRSQEPEDQGVMGSVPAPRAHEEEQ